MVDTNLSINSAKAVGRVNQKYLHESSTIGNVAVNKTSQEKDSLSVSSDLNQRRLLPYILYPGYFKKSMTRKGPLSQNCPNLSSYVNTKSDNSNTDMVSYYSDKSDDEDNESVLSFCMNPHEELVSSDEENEEDINGLSDF